MPFSKKDIKFSLNDITNFQEINHSLKSEILHYYWFF